MAGRTEPLVEKNCVFDVKTPSTLEQVRTYILVGAKRYGSELTFKVDADSPGALQLVFSKGDDHSFSVLFTYTAEEVKTTYLSSKNLNYAEEKGARVIHPNYLTWMDGILKQVQIAQSLHLNEEGEISDPNLVAELVFKTNSSWTQTSFYLADVDSDNQCGELEKVGVLTSLSPEQKEARKKEVEDWNRNVDESIFANKETMFGRKLRRTYVENTDSLTRHVAGGKPVHVRGVAVSSALKASCRPLDYRFTPEIGKKYTIELNFAYNLEGSPRNVLGTCSELVFDDTDPQARKLVLKEEAPECKQSMFKGSFWKNLVKPNP